MNYLDPQKRAILAGEYVLGTMPPAVRANFERNMRYDAGLARLVEEWSGRFAAIDERTRPVTPPARVWRTVVARTAPVKPVRAGSWIESLHLWRALTVGAVAVAAALLIVLGSMTMGPLQQPRVVAVLADKDGQPGWIVSEDKPHAALTVASVRAQTVDAQHAFELWVIADDKPRPLGVISPRPDQRVAIPLASLPKNGVAFAVSIEPPGGSPTGSPTGPVVYQGRVLNDS